MSNLGRYKIRSVALAALVLCLAAPAGAAVRHVENWGVDSGSCGAIKTPCRSIGKAVSLAAPGDTVVVGPGRYSNDLNGNSVYDEAGEEPSAGINVTGLTVKSTRGAAATRIEYASGSSAFGVVYATASAVLGMKNHGFTIVYQPSFCASPFSVDLGAGSVLGNVLFANCLGSGGIIAAVVRDNRVAALATGGLDVGVSSSTLAERNVVIGTGIGFNGNGIFRHNVALENGIGFVLVNPAVTEFTNNIAVANSSYGILLASLATVTGSFKKNTIVGNDVATNCGLYNDSGGAVTATKNFWGAATGPGADPADLACNGVGSSTVTTPFLIAPVAPGPGSLQ